MGSDSSSATPVKESAPASRAPGGSYNSITVALNKAFSHQWLAQVSYTWQHLDGNIEGLFKSKTGQLDPNINTDFDLPTFAINRSGPLPGDVRQTIKAYLSKEFVAGSGVQHHRRSWVHRLLRDGDRFLAYSSLGGVGEAFVFPADLADGSPGFTASTSASP
jgi:hypothetical protein